RSHEASNTEQQHHPSQTLLHGPYGGHQTGMGTYRAYIYEVVCHRLLLEILCCFPNSRPSAAQWQKTKILRARSRPDSMYSSRFPVYNFYKRSNLVSVYILTGLINRATYCVVDGRLPAGD